MSALIASSSSAEGSSSSAASSLAGASTGSLLSTAAPSSPTTSTPTSPATASGVPSPPGSGPSSRSSSSSLVVLDLGQHDLRCPQVAGREARLLDVGLRPPRTGQDGFHELLVEGISHQSVPSCRREEVELGCVRLRSVHARTRTVACSIWRSTDAPGFVGLTLEIEQAGHVVALAVALGGEDLGGDPVGPLVEAEPLETEQAAVDGVGDPVRADHARGPATAGRGSPGRGPRISSSRPAISADIENGGWMPWSFGARCRTIARNSSRAGVDGSWSGPISSDDAKLLVRHEQDQPQELLLDRRDRREDPVDRQRVGGADHGVRGDPALDGGRLRAAVEHLEDGPLLDTRTRGGSSGGRRRA